MVFAKLYLGSSSESNLKKPPGVSQIQVLVVQPVFQKIKLNQYRFSVFLENWKETTRTSPSFCCSFSTGYCRFLVEDVENSPREHFHEACYQTNFENEMHTTSNHHMKWNSPTSVSLLGCKNEPLTPPVSLVNHRKCTHFPY